MRKLCLLWAVCALLGVATVGGLAEAVEVEEISSGDFRYIVLEDGTAEITGWDGAGEALAVPEALDGIPVTAIGEYALSYCEALEQVELPQGLRRIGNGAFEGDLSLAGIDLPDSVEEVDANPFLGCASLREIGVSADHARLAFHDGGLFVREDGRLVSWLPASGLTEYAVPEGTLRIGAGAFSGCESLAHIRLPDGLLEIGNSAFSLCTALEEAEIPDSVNEIAEYAFANCARLESVRLPNGLREVPAECFINCESLESVRLPAGVKAVGESAFEGCGGLVRAELPEGIVEIGDEAFAYCVLLESVALPESVERLGVNPFLDCESLSALTVGEGGGLSVADGALFADGGRRLVCYLKALEQEEYAVPEGTERIDDFAFFFCNGLVSVTVPDSVTSIGANAFDGRGNLTLTVGRDSYAAAYAAEYGLKYTYPDADAWLAD